jgi:hypothetical protein
MPPRHRNLHAALVDISTDTEIRNRVLKQLEEITQPIPMLALPVGATL